jgi:DNA mismatch repair protein MutS
MFNNVEVAKTLYHVSNTLVGRVRRIAHFLRAFLPVHDDPHAMLTCRTWFFMDDVGIVEKVTIPDNVRSASDRRPMLLSNFGTELAWLKNCDRGAIAGVVRHAYMLDAIASIVRLKRDRALCEPRFDTETLCSLAMKGFWHPSLTESPRLVRNDVETTRNVILLTGPNASGKSSCLKAVLINALFAQTMGLCYAHQVEVAPFHSIESSIFVGDDKERASLFEQECMRCADTLRRLTAHPDRHHLVIFDEILSSTNTVDGISAAYAVVQRMAHHDNACAIVSTHYAYLSRLARGPDACVRPMCMRAIVRGSSIEYPYRLCDGVNRQAIAIEVMRAKGVFDDDLLNAADAVRGRLLSLKRNKTTHDQPVCRDAQTDEEEQGSKLGGAEGV